jgi:hypothetical protein
MKLFLISILKIFKTVALTRALSVTPTHVLSPTNRVRLRLTDRLVRANQDSVERKPVTPVKVCGIYLIQIKSNKFLTKKKICLLF